MYVLELTTIGFIWIVLDWMVGIMVFINPNMSGGGRGVKSPPVVF